MEQKKKMTPVEGVEYRNRNGATYLCLSAWGDGMAIMRHTVSGWTLVAHGVRQYGDGTIEWDYSTGGFWP